MALAAQELKIILQAVDNVTAPLASAKTAVSALATQTTQAAAQMNQAAASTGGAFSKMGTDIKQGIAMGAGFSTVQIAANLVSGAVKAAGDAVIGFNSKLQSAQAAFTGLLGSAQAADVFLKELQQFAATTPFEFQDVLRASQRFLGMGMAAQNVIPLLRDIGVVVSAMGGGTEQVNRVTLAIAQMSAKGKVSAEEMNQLAEAGVMGWKLLSDSMGLPIAQLMKMAEQGEITADMMIQAMQRAAADPAMKAAAKAAESTWQTAMSNMGDGIQKFLSTAGRPLFDALTNAALAIADWLTKSKQAEILMNSLAGIVKGLVDQWVFWFGIIGKVASALGGFVGMLPGVQAMGASMAGTATATEAVATATETATARRAELNAGIADSAKQTAAFNTQIKAAEVEIKKNADALRANAGEIRAVKAEADAVKASFEAQRAPLEETARSLERQASALKTQAADIKLAYAELEAPIKAALTATEFQLKSNKTLIDETKESYAAQIDPLQRGVDALTKQYDAQRQLFDLQDRINSNALKRAMIDAEGDPVKKQVLVQLLAKNDLEMRGLSLQKEQRDIQKQLSDLNKARKEGTINTADYNLQKEILQAKQRQNELERASFDLIDKTALAQAKGADYALQRSSQGRQLVQDTFDIQNKIVALPLEQQILNLKKAESERLDILEKARDSLEKQAKSQKDMLDGLVAAQAAVLKPIEAQATAVAREQDKIKARIGEIKDAEQDALVPVQAKLAALEKSRDALQDQADKLKDVKAGLEEAKRVAAEQKEELQAALAAADALAKVPPGEAIKAAVEDSAALEEQMPKTEASVAAFETNLGVLLTSAGGKLSAWMQEYGPAWDVWWAARTQAPTENKDPVRDAVVTFLSGAGETLATWNTERTVAWTAFWAAHAPGVTNTNEAVLIAVNAWLKSIQTALDTWEAARLADWNTFWGGLKAGAETGWKAFTDWLGGADGKGGVLGTITTWWTDIWKNLPKPSFPTIPNPFGAQTTSLRGGVPGRGEPLGDINYTGGGQAAAIAVQAINEAADRYGIPRIYALALAKAESDLNPTARRTTDKEDSVGLFQLNRKGGQGAGFSVETLEDPFANADIFLRDKKELYERLAQKFSGAELAAQFGGAAEVSEEQYWYRYADAYRELLKDVQGSEQSWQSLTTNLNDVKKVVGESSPIVQKFEQTTKQAGATATETGKALATTASSDLPQVSRAFQGLTKTVTAEGQAISVDYPQLMALTRQRAQQQFDALGSGGDIAMRALTQGVVSQGQTLSNDYVSLMQQTRERAQEQFDAIGGSASVATAANRALGASGSDVASGFKSAANQISNATDDLEDWVKIAQKAGVKMSQKAFDALVKDNNLESFSGGIDPKTGKQIKVIVATDEQQRAAGLQSRDAGGPVVAGQSYMIGLNRKPEVFTPGASGFVTPLGGGGRSTNISINVEGSVLTEGQLIAAIKRGLRIDSDRNLTSNLV